MHTHAHTHTNAQTHTNTKPCMEADTLPKHVIPLLSKVGGWYVDCSHKYKINQGVMVDGRRPSVEDDLWWKTIFDGRRPSVEDDLRWKTAFGGRRPLYRLRSADVMQNFELDIKLFFARRVDFYFFRSSFS